MEDAKAIVEAWRRDYNETRPHMALNDIAPEVYARQLGLQNAEN
jgi:putative transposase